MTEHWGQIQEKLAGELSRVIRGTQRANEVKNPLRDISRLLVMFKYCLKSCFDHLEKFDPFGFLS